MFVHRGEMVVPKQHGHFPGFDRLKQTEQAGEGQLGAGLVQEILAGVTWGEKENMFFVILNTALRSEKWKIIVFIIIIIKQL